MLRPRIIPCLLVHQGGLVKTQAFKDPKYVGEGAGIAVRKGNTELVSQLNTAIDGIRASGEYQKISEKYFKADIYGD